MCQTPRHYHLFFCPRDHRRKVISHHHKLIINDHRTIIYYIIVFTLCSSTRQNVNNNVSRGAYDMYHNVYNNNDVCLPLGKYYNNIPIDGCKVYLKIEQIWFPGLIKKKKRVYYIVMHCNVSHSKTFCFVF